MPALLLRSIKPHASKVGVVIALLLLQAMGNLYLPSLNADIINRGVLLGDTGYILSAGGLMLLVTLLLGVASIAAVYLSAQVSMRAGREIRSDLFRHAQGFALREVNQFGAPSLITRNTNDVQQFQMFLLLAMTMMISAPIMGIGGIIMAVRENVRLSGLLLVIVPLMTIVIGILVRQAVPLFRSMQGKIDRINQVTRENLAGIRVIRAFVRTRHEQDRFAEANEDLTRTALRVNQLFALMFPTLMLILNMSSVAVIWFGGHLVNDGNMPIGNLTAFLSYLMQILFAVMMAVMMLVMVPRAAASAERIQDVLEVTPAITDPEEPVQVPPGDGSIEFRGVEFRYPGAAEPVLHDVSLTIYPGQITAVVGSTGSGKSTLINLIPRLYDVTAGSVLVDGVDVREMATEALWSRIGLVPQRAFLFTGSIADNIRFAAPQATEQEVWEALEIAQAEDFVRAMPDGLQSSVDQGGANLSGGQRQRMAIARAIARRPEIYVFDDSFSALDYGTDARLRAALAANTAGSTVLIVAQRVNTIMNADRIIVMERGAVVGAGRHEELMRDCQVYQEIVSSQLGAQEVA